METANLDLSQVDIIPGWIFGLGALGLAILAIVIILVFIFKGVSLWTSARRGEKAWFIVLLIVNTMGILELIYLLGIAKVNPFNGRPFGSGSGYTPSTPPSSPSSPSSSSSSSTPSSFVGQ